MSLRMLLPLLVIGETMAIQGSEPSPVFADGKFVAATQQAAPWICPEGVPEKLREAAGKLFPLGYADPRGLDYKSATLFADQETAIAAHAWLFTADNGLRYAVAWNGMVYAVETEGERADLEADVQAVITKDDAALAHDEAEHEKDAKAWEQREGRPYPFSVTFWSRVRTPYLSFSKQRLWFNMPLVLLRLGQTENAIQLWNRWFNTTDPDREARASDDLVREWLGAWKDRARHAHAHGDDSVSLASLRFIEQTLHSTGVPRYRGARVPFGHEELLADQERRFAERNVQRIRVGDWEAAVQLPVEQRAAEWIRWLEDADRKQAFEIERRLLALGDAAFEPVLKALVREMRLTRRPMDFFSGPPPHTIAFAPVWNSIASLAAQLAGVPHGVLPAREWAMRNARFGEDEVRKSLLTFLREQAIQNKDLPMDAIAWRYLNDNDDPSLWSPAAKTLAQQLNSFYLDDPAPQMKKMGEALEPLKAGRAPGSVLIGERYRAQTQPSVSELLRQRAEQLDKLKKGSEAAEVRQSLKNWEAVQK